MTKEKKLAPQERHYEKVDLEEYDEFVAMIDRMFFKLTGEISNRTPEDEAEMRAEFEKTKAENALKKKVTTQRNELIINSRRKVKSGV